MVKVKIAPILVEAAQAKAERLGNLRGSIREGEGNVIGFLGEYLVAGYIGVAMCNTYDYDLIKDGYKLDIKTKSCNSRPKPEYECSVSDFNTKQECDYYVFVRIMEDLTIGWILGAIKKESYFKKARFCKKGEVDEKSELGWKFKADCYNLEIGELKPLKGDLTEDN